MLVDFQQYGLGLRADIRLEKSIHVAFGSDQTAWRCIMRVDAQGLWDTALTPKVGDDLSPFVALATRA